MSLLSWPRLRRWLPLRCLLVALAGLLSLGVWWSGWNALHSARQHHQQALARLQQAEQLQARGQHRQTLASRYTPIWQQLRRQGRLAGENRLLALETLSALRQHPGVDSLSYQLGPRQPLAWPWPNPQASSLRHSPLQLTFRLNDPAALPELFSGLALLPGLLLPADCQWQRSNETGHTAHGECQLVWVSGAETE